MTKRKVHFTAKIAVGAEKNNFVTRYGLRHPL